MKRKKSLGKVTTTPRGFELIKFQDHYLEECSLQASSLALYTKPGTSAVWLGVGEHRMHLTRPQVEALINHLQSWLDNDTFKLTYG